ncbi:D-lactaldehyde dehydrogenase [Vararia minispora EC-137]|uniref:D-lactaldehyde dehydrogenase n=1 Tax=Vararia minispora EC-137 TaxID=1314806 RepID=A0ACB8QJT3_9AGAM|nr:D-lactaldehyde dehydrogenase [Vararia minispora EC-137]
MASSPTSQRVLITGANGYIAAWLCRIHLEQGDSVLGTVRAASKGKLLEEIFVQYGDRFKIAVVEDITKPGAFDEVVKGVDIVQHTASPTGFNWKTAEEAIGPAVRGTVGILESVKNFGTSVHRVVLLSSVVAVGLGQPTQGRTVLDESSWNDWAVAEVEEKGDASSPAIMYRASKTLAERAAWKFMDDNKASISFDLAAVNPALNFGPPIPNVGSLDELSRSLAFLYQTLLVNTGVPATFDETDLWFVDVRDVAQALFFAARNPRAGGERFLIAATPYLSQDAVDAANEVDPTIKATVSPGAAGGKTVDLQYDTSKAARILGMTDYRSLKVSIKDSLAFFKTLSVSASV